MQNISHAGCHMIHQTWAAKSKRGSAEDSPGDLPCPEKLDSPTGSPPTALSSSLTELENCVSNLNLAHELVLNRDFCFKPSLPIDSLEARGTDMVQRVFWHILREQLVNDPPNYSQTTLQSVLLPRHVNLMSQLDEVLDMELIRHEVDHVALRSAQTDGLHHQHHGDRAPERLPRGQSTEGPREILRIQSSTRGDISSRSWTSGLMFWTTPPLGFRRRHPKRLSVMG
ncbi:hypothetical protein JOQ06_014808 [Pogonophryne albipinna]|uniref:Uncharacterized protein n=1 Tax=Pogonophryne albipinna TaxID=1090488 RepID=A0AAD6ALQ1_9TELE|nr:hypothetical protein JOQ06_014808 [Pogonophryne albipinna]